MSNFSAQPLSNGEVKAEMDSSENPAQRTSFAAITVKKALEKVIGVTSVTVDFDKRTASVTFDPDKTNPATLAQATSDAGCPSTVHN